MTSLEAVRRQGRSRGRFVGSLFLGIYYAYPIDENRSGQHFREFVADYRGAWGWGFHVLCGLEERMTVGQRQVYDADRSKYE